ncbi:hypothetical protein JYU34_005979 [Plutella xylostella]|uniref:Uncharacterized protein n=1 Tax=Plutella xylostella TaxID=51655 RepID=A0ABQ7Q7Q8_PLUXY|nr:hypothetical protein JYU34_018444 [Plutella xylostella]KAG7301130.1 hypothetical protein JYU34_015547 [Plutella xylostella]KAG7308748.1 hypothetical protein JYU34_005979 [Plutella xylostella]
MEVVFDEPGFQVVLDEPVCQVVFDEPGFQVVLDEPVCQVVFDEPGFQVVFDEPGFSGGLRRAWVSGGH